MQISGKRWIRAALAGACSALILLIFISVLLSVLPEGHARGIISTPFLAVCYPIIDLGESFFGQAPVPIFVFLGLCWMICGVPVGLLVAILISRKSKKKGALS